MIQKPDGWYNGIVTLETLATNYNQATGLDVYLALNKEYARSLITNVLKKLGCSINKVDSLLCCNRKASLRHLYEGYKICFSDLQKLLFALGEPLDYPKINAIAAKHGAFGSFSNLIENPRLPFDFRNEAGARLVASLLHDGGISTSLNPHFTSITPELRVTFVKNMSSLFGEILNKSSCPDLVECVVFPKIVGIALVYGLGLNFGTRAVKDALIPKFIFNLKKELRWAFVSQAIDEDGTFDMAHKQNRIAICHAKQVKEKVKTASDLLFDTKKLLNGLGVKVYGPLYNSAYLTKKGEIRERWMIRICKTEIKKVWDNIHLIIPFKQQRLMQVVST